MIVVCIFVVCIFVVFFVVGLYFVVVVVALLGGCDDDNYDLQKMISCFYYEMDGSLLTMMMR